MKKTTTLFFYLLCCIAPGFKAMAQCPGGQTQVKVTIVLDKYGDETSWSLKGISGTPTYKSGGPYTTNTSGTIKKDSVCIADGTTVNFTILDSYGDGICCSEGNGSYTVMSGLLTAASGGQFEYDESTLFVVNPFGFDMTATALNMNKYNLKGSNSIKGTFYNLGTTAITSLTANYSIDNGPTQSYNISSVNILPSKSYNFTHNIPWVTSTSGVHSVKIWASNLNGNNDDNLSNDALTQTIIIVNELTARTQLFEEVTGANCGPCAATNPNLNTLLKANEGKVVSIKYQGPHGGSMGNNTALYKDNLTDANARMTYYGNPGAPNGILDGNVYNGHAGGFTQSMINQRTSQTSPFTITTSHSFSAANDSVYVSAVVKATAAASGTLKAHMVVIEKDIYFNSAPGTNGEKHFEDVMKKMLPSANGTSMPSSMAEGDSLVLSGKWKMANVYDKSQIRAVVFVQDNSTKEVHQAAISAPVVVGINENGNLGNQLKVHPNPASHNVSINFTIAQNELVNIEIYNALGVVVFRNNNAFFQAGEHKMNIDLTDLSSGFYFINLTTKNSSDVVKLNVSK